MTCWWPVSIPVRSSGSTSHILFQFGSFPGLLCLEHRLKMSFESWSHCLRKVSGGGTKASPSERLRLTLHSHSILGNLKKSLDCPKSQFPHVQIADKTHLRFFWRWNEVMSVKHQPSVWCSSAWAVFPCFSRSPSMPVSGSPTCCYMGHDQASPPLCSSSWEWREEVEIWHMRLHAQPREGERILPGHAEGRKGKLTVTELSCTPGIHRPFTGVFTHSKNQQGNWTEGDTTTWAALPGWCVAAAHRTRMKCYSCSCRCGEHHGMYLAGHLPEGPPVLFWISWLEGWEKWQHTQCSLEAEGQVIVTVPMPSEHSVWCDHPWGQTQWVSLVLADFFYNSAEH